MRNISETGKELTSQFKLSQPNPESSFAVTTSSDWDAIRPRNHEEFKAKGQEKALTERMSRRSGSEAAVREARQRIENTNQFMKNLSEKLKERREECEEELKRMDETENPLPRNHPLRTELQTQIANIKQLEDMFASIDTRGTRDAIYWAVGIGGEIDDADPELVQTLSEKASQISKDMEIALKGPLLTEDTRGETEKLFGINEPSARILGNDSVNLPYLTAYAQDAGNLVYSEKGSIEHFVVHCALRMESNGGNLEGALDALEIPFAEHAAGQSELKQWMIPPIRQIIFDIHNNPPTIS